MREQRVFILRPNGASVLTCLKKLSISGLSWKECVLIAERKDIEKERKKKKENWDSHNAALVHFHLFIYAYRPRRTISKKELVAEDTPCFKAQKKVNGMTFPLSPNSASTFSFHDQSLF